MTNAEKIADLTKRAENKYLPQSAITKINEMISELKGQDTKPTKEILTTRLKIVQKMISKNPTPTLKTRAKIIEKMLSSPETFCCGGGIQMQSGGAIEENRILIGDYVRKTERKGAVKNVSEGTVYQKNGDLVKLEDKYGNKSEKWFELKGFKKITMEHGGNVAHFRQTLELYEGDTGTNPFNIPVYIKPNTDNVFVFKSDIIPIWIEENKKRAELNKEDAIKTKELEALQSKGHTKNTKLYIERSNKKDSLKRNLDKLHTEMGDLATTVGSIIPRTMSNIYDEDGSYQTRADLQEELINKYFHDIYEVSNKIKKTGGPVDKIDLFEDYENIPSNIQLIIDNYSEDFEDGNYNGLSKALKEIEKIGYTFEYYLDGQAYGLRPINVPLNELRGYEEMKKGGLIPNNYKGKTPEQVWNGWNSNQRAHFISDHEVLSPLKKIEYDYLSTAKWNSIPDDIEGIHLKGVISQHISQGQYGKGANIRAFGSKLFSKTKDITKKGYESAKSHTKNAAEKSKKYVDKKIHDKKLDIAYEVLQETRVITDDKRESQMLNEASNIVEEKYKKGGPIGKKKSRSASKVLQLMDKDYSYTDALNKVLKKDLRVDKAKLEKELNKYI
jgi:hypothetical protein